MPTYVAFLVPHPTQTLVKRGPNMLSRAADPVGTTPHAISGFSRDHQLIAIVSQVLAEDLRPPSSGVIALLPETVWGSTGSEIPNRCN